MQNAAKIIPNAPPEFRHSAQEPVKLKNGNTLHSARPALFWNNEGPVTEMIDQVALIEKAASAIGLDCYIKCGLGVYFAAIWASAPGDSRREMKLPKNTVESA